MNIRLTGNPEKATHIRNVTPKPVDTSAGERFMRTAPRFGDLDESERTFKATVATSTPVLRRDARGTFWEVLDANGLILDSGLNAPLLLDHKQGARETVGRAFDFQIDGSAVHASLRLGMADDVEPIFQRVKDGTLRHVSVGYAVLQWAESRNAEGQRVKTATRWRLLEVSLTPIPADPQATITRSAEMPFDNPEDRDLFVMNIRTLAGLPEAWADDLPEDADEDAIRTAAREALAQRSAPKITIRRDHTDPAQIQTRAADALSYRMGGRADLPEASREFVNMSLMDHARDAVQRTGVSTRGLSADEVLARAMTTSDFPLTVANAAGKVAADGYQAAETALKPLFRQRSLSDFKTSTAVRLGGMGQLEEMTESGEFKAVSRGEAGESLQLRTFGRRLDLSRRLIVNDDLSLFADTTRALGEAAAQTEAALMADLLTGNDKLSDGKALFHASRGNVLTYAVDAERAAAYMSLILALDEGRKIMRNQKNLDGVTPIVARPKYVIAGPETESLLGSITDYDSSFVNPLDMLTWRKEISVLIDPRITDKTIYLAADPAACAVFNQAIFAAAPGPQIQRQESWDTLGVSFRCWMDTGVGFAGWRGIVKIGG
ncbi:phage major capsid protein [Paenirhodobacter populi]|uniref:Prohead serine protease domain-containing protein n=1 Tax=Paenirhodobacter populi TaxID=2306993 RepID=A0A443IVD4_9RHOB|nr:HK97 family phage prohead protease [Sinirhodobacter populi]RWR12046.1 hypothetical protein D2T33_10185 [Sinirhodobacter populi]